MNIVIILLGLLLFGFGGWFGYHNEDNVSRCLAGGIISGIGLFMAIFGTALTISGTVLEVW